MTYFVYVVRHDLSKFSGQPILIHLSLRARRACSGHRARLGHLVCLPRSVLRALLAHSVLWARLARSGLRARLTRLILQARLTRSAHQTVRPVWVFGPA